jgi:diguanylate cyclase (GGDEF)-like protein/PAS domain S-box-containing protein
MATSWMTNADATAIAIAARDPSQDRYGQMLAHSATAAVCAGPEGLILSWNTGAEMLFGYAASEAIGQPLSIIIPENHRAAHHAGLARAVRAGEARLAGNAVEILALHANGSEFPIDLSLSMWFEAGKPMFGALMRDIADRHSAKQRLEHLAHCDTVTSLPNRNALHVRLAADIGRVPCALLLLDLDGFKHVNDTLGHSFGDQLLAAVGVRLATAAGNQAFVARLGGDEFAVVLSDCADPVWVDEITTQIFKSLQLPFELAGQSIYVGTSIGIAMAPRDAVEVDLLLSSADLALYSAKSDGGGVRTFFARAMQNRSEQRHRLGSELRQALANDELELWYQPQVCLADTSLSGVEALLRWRHPDHGLLTPDIFIDVLEASVIAEEVGDWIVDQACAFAAYWKRAGFGSLRVGVNLFAAQLRSDRLLEVVSSALKRHDLTPDQLELEITETTVLRDGKQSTQALGELKRLGVGIAFDDFGTGFASLSLLQKYPLTRLKIDRSFVARIDREVGDAAIVKAVIGMTRSLGLLAIAEGVETAEQEAALVRLGCDEAQGYRYGRPMPASDLVDLSRDRGAVA